jgi:hypothetical protein
MLSRWYRTGVIYSLDIGLFQDANGDGIGHIQGLISRLDYLADLRVTTIWLNPIHPSPRRDGGYDITEYFGVHLGPATPAGSRPGASADVRLSHRNGPVLTSLRPGQLTVDPACLPDRRGPLRSLRHHPSLMGRRPPR